MLIPTIQSYAYVQFRQPDRGYSLDFPVGYTVAFTQALPSDQKLGLLEGPISIPAGWIGTIERRIEQSVPDPSVSNIDVEEGWLNPAIATYALWFFNATSDVLPSIEPYLYTATNGDLVAEFAGRRGKLTNVIGKGVVNSFAVVDGQMLKTTLNFPLDDVSKARQELMEITKQL